MKTSLISFVALLLAASFAAAQQKGSEFTIEQITPDLVTTPDYSYTLGPQGKRVSKNKDWLEVEVSFDWKPRNEEPAFLDELTLNYYILLNDNSDPRKNTLLTGSVTHTAIPQGKGLKSVMYVSPRTLERFFKGKLPNTVTAAVFNVGITITRQGQLVAEGNWKGDDRQKQWWSGFQQTAGYVLNKNETPFAPLVWDYYEAIKARPGGM